MTITRAEAAMLAARGTAPVREGWRDGALTVFVAGRPRNPMNGSHEHWSKRAKWAKGWRERTATACFRVPIKPTEFLTTLFPSPATPKLITFTVHGPGRFDDDGLRNVVKPVRDALRDLALIDDDRDSAGHSFAYTQEARRKAGTVYGVTIRVRLRG